MGQIENFCRASILKFVYFCFYFLLLLCACDFGQLGFKVFDSFVDVLKQNQNTYTKKGQDTYKRNTHSTRNAHNHNYTPNTHTHWILRCDAISYRKTQTHIKTFRFAKKQSLSLHLYEDIYSFVRILICIFRFIYLCTHFKTWNHTNIIRTRINRDTPHTEHTKPRHKEYTVKEGVKGWKMKQKTNYFIYILRNICILINGVSD